MSTDQVQDLLTSDEELSWLRSVARHLLEQTLSTRPLIRDEAAGACSPERGPPQTPSVLISSCAPAPAQNQEKAAPSAAADQATLKLGTEAYIYG